MTIRKIQSPYSYITKTIIIAIIAMIIIGQTLHRGNKQITITQESSAIQAPDGIQINSIIQATGRIQQDSNFPIHTHSLILDNQAKIGLRSTTINLNNFLDTYEVSGIIHNINKGIPSIDIDRIRNNSNSLFIQENIYTYLEQQIIINLTKLPAIYSNMYEDSIVIIADQIPIITIQKISCQDSETCELYKNNSETERFTSTVGHTFYKKQEGQRRLTHENKNIYIVQGDDDDIIDFSSVIELLDSAYIVKKHQVDIFNGCNELENITQAETTQEGKITKLTAIGTNTKNETVGCNISFDLRNNRGITNISLF